MSSQSTFQFTFSNSDADDNGSIWLTAKQEDLPIADNIAGISDVARMLAVASGGQSAHMYAKDAPNLEIKVDNENGVVNVFFTTFIYVFHSPGLNYSRSATYGEFL